MELKPSLAQSYYYCCLSIIAGRRVKNLSLKEVRTIETYLNAAISLDEKNQIFKLLLLLVKLDYYIYNGLKDTEPFCISIANDIDETSIDTTELEMLKIAVKTKDIDSVKLKKKE